MNNTSIDKQFYTYADLMRRWDVSRMTIHRMVKSGQIKKTYIRGSVRFSAAMIAAYERMSGS